MSTTPKRPMLPDEILAAKLLQQVTYPVASWDKRFARTLAFLTATPPPPRCSCSMQQLDMSGNPIHVEPCPMAVAQPAWQPMISERAAPQLWRLVWRYRRQIKHPDRTRLFRLAEKLMPSTKEAGRSPRRAELKAKAERELYARAMAQKNPQTTEVANG